MSYGEQIALRGHADLEEAATAASIEVRSTAEDQFLERLRRGEAAAFERVVAEHTGDVYALLYRLTSDPEEARDLTQETFLRAFQSIARFRGDANLKTWIYRIAVNLCKNRVKYLKRRRTEAQDEYEAMAERSPMTSGSGVTSGDIHRPDQMVEGMQLERVVQLCIVELDPDFREVLILRDVEDLSYEELCEVTGLPDGTVKSRLHRARAMLKQAVERKMGDKAK